MIIPIKKKRTRREKATALFLAMSFFVAALEARGQETRAPRESLSSKQAVLNSPRVFKDALVSPFHWKKNDFLGLSIILGSGLILSLMDEDIQEWSQERRTRSSDDFFTVATKFGEGTYLCGFMAGLYLAGTIAGRDGLRTTALLSFESFLVTSLFNTTLKSVIGRARPGMGEGSHSFHPFSTRSGTTSFPSGHSVAVWSVATVIADRTDNGFVDAACYSLAALSSLSRIHQNKHWASDVLVGSALGYFTAKKICALNRNPGTPKLSAGFDLSGKRRALTLSLSF